MIRFSRKRIVKLSEPKAQIPGIGLKDQDQIEITTEFDIRPGLHIIIENSSGEKAKLNILSQESDGVWLTYFEDPKGLMTGHGQEYYMHQLSKDDIKHTIKVKIESPSDELSFE